MLETKGIAVFRLDVLRKYPFCSDTFMRPATVVDFLAAPGACHFRRILTKEAKKTFLFLLMGVWGGDHAQTYIMFAFARMGLQKPTYCILDRQYSAQ